MIRFAVSNRPIDPAALRADLSNPGHGGFCAFEGWVRDTNEGRGVDGLEYEIYEALAQREGDRILAEAKERFGNIDAIGIHRSGMLRIGDLAVWVGVSGAHRDECFRACRYIIDQIKHRLPVWKKEHYLAGDAAWVACAHPAADDDHAHHAHEHHHAHPGQHEQHHVAAAPFVPDYSRQTCLPDVGENGQNRLAASSVLVIGAGGLGSPVLALLAGAGVGRLGIVDHDRVEASNLHRQTLYVAADIGRKKAQAAAARVAAINPTAQVEVFEERVRPADAVALFRRFDLVVECSDDMRSRFLCSDAAMLSGTPLILASVHQHEGQLQVIRDGGPCLRCVWPAEPAPGAAGSCAESGVLGPVPGVLGAMQANEALKLLLGLQKAPDASLLLVDLLDNSTQRLRIDTGSGCITRGGCVAVARRALLTGAIADLELGFETLAAARDAGFHLVDIRNADELAADPLFVPAQWLPAPLLEKRSDELPSDGPLLLVCASGRRSIHAARQLRSAGRTDAFSLAGGLRAVR